MDEQIKLLTSKQVSGYLQIPLRTVHRLSKQGKIKAFRVGGQWRYLYNDIKDYGAGRSIDEKERFLTAKEVSEYLHIHLRTVHRLSSQGKIRSFKIGGHWKYLREDIEKYGLNGTDFCAEAERIPRLYKEMSGRAERRVYPRINTNFDCRYSVCLPPFRDISSNGIIKNISGGGVYLFSENNVIDTGDPIEISFIMDKGQDISAKGKVVRKDAHGVGIKFRDIDKKAQNKIISYAG